MKIKNIIGILFIMVLIIAPNAMAFRDVTCGRPNDKCVEGKLQDEFNEIEDMIEENEDDIDDLQRTNNRQWHAIRANDRDIRNNDNDIDDLENTILANDAKWSQDSSGTSMSSVRKFVFGEFFDYISAIFTKQKDFETLEDKMYLLEAKLYFFEEGMEYNSNTLLFKAVELEMTATGVDDVQHGKYGCSIMNDKIVCVG